jgi:hypothetical protein
MSWSSRTSMSHTSPASSAPRDHVRVLASKPREMACFSWWRQAANVGVRTLTITAGSAIVAGVTWIAKDLGRLVSPDP